MLHGKKIILGITGGIAAYKCGHLVRLLIKKGAEVKVIMTREACNFITPQTLSVLSKNQVVTDFFDPGNNWNDHVKLALWADVLLIAPLTANSLAKMAAGLADNVLLVTYLSARTKTIIAPAMDLDMYKHPTVRKNLTLLESFGNLMIPPESGFLASGLEGEGRMAEPENIAIFLEKYFGAHMRLSGKKALVNGGPTFEPIDPVRYIGNRSSGKMGVSLAEALAAEGAEVTLVLGPGNITPAQQSIIVKRVETSDEMYDAMLTSYDKQDIVICSAAVADYRPAETGAQKIKKPDKEIAIRLVKTKDILEELGRLKNRQYLVGFALETENMEKYAREKLAKKNLDLIVANSAIEAGSGFSGDTNKITLIDRHNKLTKFELKTKNEVASDIVEYILQNIDK